MRRGWLVYLVRLSSFRFPRTRFVYERESAFPLGPRAFSLAGAGNLKREMRQQRNYERFSFPFFLVRKPDRQRGVTSGHAKTSFPPSPRSSNLFLSCQKAEKRFKEACGARGEVPRADRPFTRSKTWETQDVTERKPHIINSSSPKLSVAAFSRFHSVTYTATRKVAINSMN